MPSLSAWLRTDAHTAEGRTPGAESASSAPRFTPAVPEWCAIFPPWHWRLRPARVANTLTGMIGSSFAAVFRKDAEP